MKSMRKKIILFAGTFSIILLLLVSCTSSQKTTSKTNSEDAAIRSDKTNGTGSENITSDHSVTLSHETTTTKKIQRTVELANGNKLNIYGGERYAESPSGEKLAVLKFASIGDTLANVTLYDKNGIRLSGSKVAPLDKIAVADDGRFSIYGFEPTMGIATVSNLVCYDKFGKKIYEKKNAFGVHQWGKYSSDSEIYVFWASLNNHSELKEEIILVFDMNYQLLGENIITGISRFSLFKDIEINSIENQIIIHRINIENKSMNEEQIKLNFQGEIIN